MLMLLTQMAFNEVNTNYVKVEEFLNYYLFGILIYKASF